MKCYTHPKTEAVGVCSQCGKGMCNACAVEVGGILYCREDANKLEVTNVPKHLRANRSNFGNWDAGITIASILYFIAGALGALLSVLLMALNYHLYSGIFSVLGFIDYLIGILGIILLVGALLTLLSAYWLLKHYKIGGILGIVLGILMVMTFGVGSLLGTVVIILIGLGWNTLK